MDIQFNTPGNEKLMTYKPHVNGTQTLQSPVRGSSGTLESTWLKGGYSPSSTKKDPAPSDLPPSGKKRRTNLTTNLPDIDLNGRTSNVNNFE
jgi:hypothetical protein